MLIVRRLLDVHAMLCGSIRTRYVVASALGPCLHSVVVEDSALYPCPCMTRFSSADCSSTDVHVGLMNGRLMKVRPASHLSFAALWSSDRCNFDTMNVEQGICGLGRPNALLRHGFVMAGFHYWPVLPTTCSASPAREWQRKTWERSLIPTDFSGGAR